MQELSKEELRNAIIPDGGSASCAASVLVSAAFGSLFGGGGAIVGGALALAGPNCLALYE